MDNDDNTKFVAFDKYCKKCKYSDRPAVGDPCNACLSVGGRVGTEVPECFEEKENG